MARRFFQISLGILCLAIAYNLGARSARADWDGGTSGNIAGVSEGMFITNSGEAWSYYSGTWVNSSNRNLPVPVSEIRFFDYAYFVTQSGDIWQHTGFGYEQIPSIPGGGTPTYKESWSGVKQRFRD